MTTSSGDDGRSDGLLTGSNLAYDGRGDCVMAAAASRVATEAEFWKRDRREEMLVLSFSLSSLI